MLTDVKTCVDTRVNFFGQYYEVPASVQPDVDTFIKKINALGENSSSVTDFESKFASSGLSDAFNALLTRCTPKAYQMTQEEQQQAKQTAKDLMFESKADMASYIAKDVSDSVAVEAKEELISQGRKQMIEAGVFDEYTRATNIIEDASLLGGFFAKKFKKKK